MSNAGPISRGPWCPQLPLEGVAVMTQSPTIGQKSAEAVANVHRIVGELARDDMPEAEPVLRALLEWVDTAAFRISVVGQVKAGKSSLINALTGLEDLLPTQVNPWTAVITNLHFGHPGRAPGSGVFHFFDDAEWARMLEGGSESRKLAERYLPGFTSEVLSAQIEEMQAKAKARLGGMYRLLLGKSHKFNAVTPEILARYVSAGYDDNDMARSTAGRFSGITKSADVFLDGGPFAMPATISDTPGINDPFLVRDEITTSSFDLADIFIATLSANQVLNPADIALLKMLSHHKQRNTVIFVNRIDELHRPAESAPQVVEALNARLATELGAGDRVVLSGSAEWARIALRGTDREVADTLANPDCAEFAHRFAETTDGTPRERLLALSGLPALAATLTRLGFEAKTSPAIAEGVAGALNSLDFVRGALVQRLAEDASSESATEDAETLTARERQRIDARLSELAALEETLAALTEACRTRLDDACTSTSQSVARTVRHAVDGFVDDQVASLVTSLRTTGPQTAWKFDTLAVQAQVHRQLTQSYTTGRDEFDAILRDFSVELNEALSPVVGSLSVHGVLQDLPNATVLSSFRPKADMIEVELTAKRGWKLWRSSQMSEDEAIKRITEVVRAELYPSVQTLEATIARALAGRNAAAKQRLKSLLDRAKSVIASETAELRSDAELLKDPENGTIRDRVARDRAARAEHTRRKIAALEHASLCLADAAPRPEATPSDPRAAPALVATG